VKPIFLTVALLVLLGGILIVRLRHENQALHQEQTQIEQVRSDLARALEKANACETEIQSLNSEVARLQADLEHTSSAPASAALETQPPSPSVPPTLKHPWGLTADDIDFTGMLILGNSNNGVIFVPLVGNSLVRVRQSNTNREPLVFGRLINSGNFAVWGRGGTNVGVALHYESKEKAEAIAAQMRVPGTE
jgi:hypothetical protein